MKNNKKLFIIGVVSVLVTIILISLISIIVSFINNNNKSKNFKIYYCDKLNASLVYEKRYINKKDDTYIVDIFNEMKTPSKTVNFKSVINENIQILSFNIKNKVLTLNLSKEYEDLKDVEKILLRAGLVWTMTEDENIKGVKFLVDGKNISDGNYTNTVFSRDNVILNPTISPDKIENEKVILYFGNNNNSLSPEERMIEVKQNKNMEAYIVEELILGPNLKDNKQVVPQETKIRNIKTEDNICYVDLSSDFIIKLSGNTNQQMLAIYSIVNSLTNLSKVNKVQFLIEGEKVNLSSESVDISHPLDRKKSIIDTE